MKLNINLLHFNALVFIATKIPPSTPQRWESISKYIKAVECEFCDNQKLVITIGEGRKVQNFSPTTALCKMAWQFMIKHYPHLCELDYEALLTSTHLSHGIKHIILLPPCKVCTQCGGNIVIRNRPVCPIVYTEMGPYIGALYSGQCCNEFCKITYYYSYRQTVNNETFFYDLNEDSRSFFHITTATVFSIEYIKDVTYNMVFSGVSFYSRAQVYNAKFANKISTCISPENNYIASRHDTAHLNDERLQEAWFLWSLVQFYTSEGLLHSTNLDCEFGKTSHRKNIEAACKEACNLISTTPNKWIKHVCKVLGCKEGYVSVDGNEKLKRPMCSAPHTTSKTKPHLPSIVVCCKNTPVYGNSSLKPTKYCSYHTQLQNVTQSAMESSDEEHQEEEDTDLSTDCMTPSMITGLPTTDSGTDASTLVGCKKNRNILKYYNTTAGIVALIRPCGIVVSLGELYTCESATQVFLFLLKTFYRPSQDVSYSQLLRYLGYDRTCDLHPYLKKQAAQGSAGAKFLLQHVQFLVDTFHCNKHTEPCCMPLDNPKCKYNPRLHRFSEIHGVNTQSCEQGFVRLNMYKHVTKHLTRYKRMFFFHEMNNHFNSTREQELTKKGQM